MQFVKPKTFCIALRFVLLDRYLLKLNKHRNWLTCHTLTRPCNQFNLNNNYHLHHQHCYRWCNTWTLHFEDTLFPALIQDRWRGPLEPMSSIKINPGINSTKRTHSVHRTRHTSMELCISDGERGTGQGAVIRWRNHSKTMMKQGANASRPPSLASHHKYRQMKSSSQSWYWYHLKLKNCRHEEP